MKMGDRVRMKNVREGSWAGDGSGRICGYEEARPYFPGGSPGSKDAPPRGPAICIALDGPKANEGKEANTVWISPTPDNVEILEDAV